MQGKPLKERKEKKMKKFIPMMIIAFLLATACYLGAQKPVRNISRERHPNLAAAQRLSQQAYEKIVLAQKANEWDLGGHAEKAKHLLEQANDELKLAAEAANKQAGK
jgi:F0F1-type ATP synthase membrane subunit b/b'